MANYDRLMAQLHKLDNRSYKAYQELRGHYQFPDFILIIDHVQGDPFAAPSKLRVMVPQSRGQFPPELYNSRSREIATRDYLARRFAQAAVKFSTHRGTGKSGLIAIAPLGQEVLERNSVLIDSEQIEVRFVLGLPARGRSILGRQAAAMLGTDLPKLIQESLCYPALEPSSLQQHVETTEDADWLRQELSRHNLLAFVANGAILPRRSGIDQRPLPQGLPFQSPPSLEVEFNCPNRGVIRGMGIPQGITLIVGGGYHGKSTLLKAIALGIYNHLPGDGREYVVTNPTAVKIRAEDGRSVTGVDISPFINHLPQRRSTQNFSTANASGSTSQAANIIEALETGTELLLVDEDTSATNFMIRDQRMQALIAKAQEPITPLIDKIALLYREHQVSTILVMGGSGDYFEVADQVIALENYLPQDVTTQAKAIAQQYRSARVAEGGEQFGSPRPRIPLATSIDPSRGKKTVKTATRELERIVMGSEEIDLCAIEQLVDPGQLKAIAAALVYFKQHYLGHNLTIAELLARFYQEIAKSNWDLIGKFYSGELVYCRPQELAAALNRLRSLKISDPPS